MKNVLVTLSIALILASCNHPNKDIKERISGADSLAINYFKGDGTMDSVVKVSIVRDAKLINQLAALIGKSSEERNTTCGYDGSLHFFKMNMVAQDIDFRMNADECMHFSFLLNGKYQATVLSREAKELINSFRK